jgi:UDP-3-O-acyl-N-acetylglucosamine deacetylase
MLGKITAIRSGHALNHQLLVTLFADADAWVAENAMTLTANPELSQEASTEALAAATA